jgi:hypothetical protein
VNDYENEREARMKLAATDGPSAPLALVEQLGQALDRLETQLGRLGESLEPVLIEREPSPALAGEPAPGRTMLSQRLQHLAAWAERLGDRANELHSRIEL